MARKALLTLALLLACPAALGINLPRGASPGPSAFTLADDGEPLTDVEPSAAVFRVWLAEGSDLRVDARLRVAQFEGMTIEGPAGCHAGAGDSSWLAASPRTAVQIMCRGVGTGAHTIILRVREGTAEGVLNVRNGVVLSQS